MLCVLTATFNLASHATNQVAASCANTDFRLDKITWESRHTTESRYLPQTSLPWAGKTPTRTDFVAKSTTMSTF